jgi:small-conductance mechanosensitive channel
VRFGRKPPLNGPETAAQRLLARVRAVVGAAVLALVVIGVALLTWRLSGNDLSLRDLIAVIAGAVASIVVGTVLWLVNRIGVQIRRHVRLVRQLRRLPSAPNERTLVRSRREVVLWSGLWAALIAACAAIAMISPALAAFATTVAVVIPFLGFLGISVGLSDDPSDYV